jgi:hypothetical protein
MTTVGDHVGIPGVVLLFFRSWAPLSLSWTFIYRLSQRPLPSFHNALATVSILGLFRLTKLAHVTIVCANPVKATPICNIAIANQVFSEMNILGKKSTSDQTPVFGVIDNQTD